MRRGPSSQSVVVGIAIGLFVVCSLLPVVYLLAFTLSGGSPAYESAWLDARQQLLLVNTTLLGAGTAIVATAIGAPLGLALARIPLRAKDLLRVALAAPVLLPPYTVALAWTYLSAWAYSLPAAILVSSMVFYPLSMLMTEAAMRTIDARLEEAALVVAHPIVVLRRITYPLAAPTVFAAALLIFVLSVSDFGVPALLRVRVYTTEIFTAFAALYDFRRAVVVAVPLLLLCAGVATLAAAVLRERLVAARRGSRPHPVLLREWRQRAAMCAGAVLVVALVIPLIALLRAASSAPSPAAIVEGSGPAIAKSLVLAAVGATAAVGVAMALGYARARARGRRGQLADVCFVVTFAMPSTIVGVGLIGVWNRPEFDGVYGTDLMLLLAYLARFVPVAALILAASIQYVPVSHEEAAAVSGAGWLRTIAHIVLPQVRLGLFAAWLIAFVLAFGELGASILVAPSSESTLPIRIYTLIANSPPSHVAILALLQATVVFVPLALLGMVSRHEAK
jgi:iron(III) transport system permease protein